MGDVVEVHGENVVLAAHVHPVLVLIHVQDPVVHGPVGYVVVFKGLGGLQVLEAHRRKKKGRMKRSNKSLSTLGWGKFLSSSEIKLPTNRGENEI